MVNSPLIPALTQPISDEHGNVAVAWYNFFANQGFNTQVSYGSGPPTVKPTQIGNAYLNRTGDKVYFAFGVSSITDWVLVSSGPLGDVQSVTGLNTDNTDPVNPVVKISVDGSSITGSGTPGSPLASHVVSGSAVTSLNGETNTVSLVSVGGTIAITTPTANTINLETTAADAYYQFSEITSSQIGVVNFWYSCNNASLITITLPGTAIIGQKLKITGKGAGGWKVAQNAGQQIHYGNLNTTLGTGGSIASINTFDCIELVCISVNSDWLVHNSQGNLTII